MKEVIATAKCRQCDGVMEGRKGEYRYIESGLNSVILKDILVCHCTKCNDIVPEIPAAGVLHRVIAMRLLLKKTLLTGQELRFLRKLCGYSINEFGEIMGSSKSVVCRWENQTTHGEGTDRIVRLLVMAKMFREIAGQPEPILKNVTVQKLVAAIRSRSGASWQLVDRALAGSFTLLLSVPLVLEYEAVLTRPEHIKVAGLAVSDIQVLINAQVRFSRNSQTITHFTVQEMSHFGKVGKGLVNCSASMNAPTPK